MLQKDKNMRLVAMIPLKDVKEYPGYTQGFNMFTFVISQGYLKIYKQIHA